MYSILVNISLVTSQESFAFQYVGSGSSGDRLKFPKSGGGGVFNGYTCNEHTCNCQEGIRK